MKHMKLASAVAVAAALVAGASFADVNVGNPGKPGTPGDVRGVDAQDVVVFELANNGPTDFNVNLGKTVNFRNNFDKPVIVIIDGVEGFGGAKGVTIEPKAHVAYNFTHVGSFKLHVVDQNDTKVRLITGTVTVGKGM